MKFTALTLGLSLPVLAGDPAPLHQAIDSSGARTTTSHYRQDASLGGITATPLMATAGGQTATNRSGYIASLFEIVSSPSITPSAAGFDEGPSTLAFRLPASFDDGTTAYLLPAWFTWSLSGAGVEETTSAIQSDGIFQPGNVWQDTTLTVTASGPLQPSSGPLQASVTIRNTGSDDLGVYAADGIDDSWQIAHFGARNPAGAGAADASGTGQSNLFKYIAGLDPLDPAARFSVLQQSQAVATNTLLTFGPCVDSRTYRILGSTDLITWTPLASQPSTPDTNGQSSVTDIHPGVTKKFYRVEIAAPGL